MEAFIFRGLTTSCICWRLQIRLDAIHIMGHWIHDLQILIVAYVASSIELVLGDFFNSKEFEEVLSHGSHFRIEGSGLNVSSTSITLLLDSCCMCHFIVLVRKNSSLN